MSEINVNLRPCVVLDRLCIRDIENVGKTQIEKTNENSSNSTNIGASPSPVAESTAEMNETDASERHNDQINSPDNPTDSNDILRENQSDVTLLNFDVAEIVQITDDGEPTNSYASANPMNRNVVMLMINFSTLSHMMVPRSTTAETLTSTVDSKENLLATASIDSAYSSGLMEVNRNFIPLAHQCIKYIVILATAIFIFRRK